jgi:hypothetical protein
LKAGIVEKEEEAIARLGVVNMFLQQHINIQQQRNC